MIFASKIFWMSKYLGLLVIILFFSCNNEPEYNFTLNGDIKGLKKGTVYLQRVNDSAFVTIDSVVINGNSQFSIKTNLDEPEVLFLRLNKNDDDESAIPFFAAKGITKIESTLQNFLYDARIEGTKQQQVLENYLKMMARFNEKNLDLIKNSLEARSKNDSLSAAEVDNELNNLLRRKYLYTINYAFSNKDSEVAPYLAVYEIPDANIKFLDTIYKSLDPSIKKSRYGLELEHLIRRKDSTR